MPQGITDDGFFLPRLPELRSDAEIRWRALFGANADTSSESNDGHEIDFTTLVTTQLWEQAFSIYSSAFFATAAGAQLDRLLALFDFPRLPDLQSSVTQRLYGVATTTILLSSIITVTDTGARFVTAAAATLPAIGTQTSFLAHCSAAGVADTWTLTIDGTPSLVTYLSSATASAAMTDMEAALALNAKVASTTRISADPAGNALVLVEMTGTHVFSTGSTGAIVTEAHVHADVLAESEEFGAISGILETIRVIGSPTSGWRGTYNPLSAAPGRLEETDEEYRTRYLERSRGAFATLDAIAAAIEESDSTVENAVVSENVTDAVVDGLLPHSIRAVVLGGDSETIGQAIWDTKAGGIATNGAVSTSPTDRAGKTQTALFDRPTELFAFATITITKGEAFPTSVPEADLEDQIKADVVVYGTALGMDGDINEAEFSAAVSASVEGMSSIAIVMAVDTVPAPVPPLSPGSIAIADDEISRWSAARLTVVLV